MTDASALDLLFPASVIPDSVHSLVSSDLVLRPLASTDHSRGHLSVLSVLTSTPDVGLGAWQEQFKAMRALNDTYYAIVLVSKADDRVRATGTVFVERKFIRGCAKVGHIEDISVSKEEQGKGLGKVIIRALTEISESLGCYKTILDCDPKNEGFYIKCGYENKGCEMAKYK